jgi:uncharacterized NAD(P)/FAD-binding protein YdhS
MKWTKGVLAAVLMAVGLHAGSGVSADGRMVGGPFDRCDEQVVIVPVASGVQVVEVDALGYVRVTAYADRASAGRWIDRVGEEFVLCVTEGVTEG